MNEKKKASPWMWVGCGCAVAIVVLAVAVAGAGFFVAKKTKDFADSMTDPVAREAKTLQVLGSDTLPPGYYPMFSVSVPWVMELAMLSDLPPNEDGEPQDFGDRGLIFLQLRGGLGTDMDELRDFFAGRTDDVSVLRDNNINIDVDEILDRGTLDRDDLELMWVAQRGDVRAMGNTRDEAITTMMLLDCPEDEKLRLAIWFEKDENAQLDSEEADFSGTLADPVKIEQYAGYLHPCRG